MGPHGMGLPEGLHASLLVEQLFWRGAMDSWDVLDTGPLVVGVVTLLLFGLGSVRWMDVP